MRKSIAAMTAVVALAVAAPAAAQSYANRSLGLGVGALGLRGGDREPVNWALVIQGEGQYYLDYGLELFIHIPFMLAHQNCCVTGSTAPQREGLVIGTGGFAGLKYNFLQDEVRPFVGIQFSGLYFAREGATYNDGSAISSNFQFGPGLVGGIEFFVNDAFSIGARGYFDLYIVLNAPVRFVGGGAATIATYF